MIDGCRLRQFMLAPLVLVGCGRAPALPPTASGAVDRSPARIEFLERDRNLGEVPVDREHTKSTLFNFSNVGGSTLRITKIAVSCHCAGATVHPETLAPGEGGELRVALKRVSARPYSATITLVTNDPDSRAVQLSLKWRAVAPIEFDPYSFDVGTVRPGTEVVRAVAVVPRAQKDGDATSCEFGPISCIPDNQLSASWSTNSGKTPATGARAMRVVLRSGDESGDFHGRVVVPLRNCRLAEIVLPLHWSVRDSVEASPPSLFLGSAPAGASLSKTVSISAAATDELEIEDVRVTPAGYGISAAIEKAARAAVIIRVDATLPLDPGVINCQLVVTCKRPVKKTLCVPVSAFSRQPE